MSYTSIAFAGFVLLSLLAYYIVPKRFRYIVLLVFSYAFYVIACNKYVVYIILSTVTTYFAALKISDISDEQKDYLKQNKETLSREDKKAYKASMKSKQRRILAACLLLNFGILGFLKYANFCIANVNLVKLMLFKSTNFLSLYNLVLPLGISFYTFQSMGYVIDMYYGNYRAERNFAKVALYVSFFPQIVQGPISRFSDLSKTLFEGHELCEKNITYGLYQIMWGVFKKVVIADRLAAYVSGAVAAYESTRGTYLLLAIFFYSMQIYGDFSGGIDITIGVARLFGVELTANFERPFFSKSVAEYWRRWHITLGTWFKDYIFYPLTVSKTIMNLGKWVRKNVNEAIGKRVPIYLAMFMVWFTTGLWHGAEWRYIVWGLLNFVILTISTEAEPLYEKINEKLGWNGTVLQKCFQVFRTFWIMSFLRVFDLSSNGVRQALVIIKRSLTDWCVPQLSVIEELGMDVYELRVAVCAILFLFCFSMIQRKGSIRDRLMQMKLPVRWAITAIFAVVIVVFGSYGIGYDSRAFIYLQF